MQHYKSLIPKKLQEMTNIVGLSFRIDDPTPRFTIIIEQDI